MKVRFFDPGKGYLKIKDEIDSEIQRVLAAGDLILRDDVEKFEQNLAEYVGKKYAVGLNSGTDALYLAVATSGLRPDRPIATRSHTFVATVQVIHQLGQKPILIDKDEKWPDYDNESKEWLSVYIPVHIAGLVDEKPPRRAYIIEDACQALGAKGLGYGDMQCWSFYPAKILGAYGDAGALTTNNKQIYEEVKELRNHYKKNYSKWGINSRMDNLQAAVLNVKIKYLDQILARRKAIAEYYLDQLKDVPIGLPENQPGRVWQDFIIRVSGGMSGFGCVCDCLGSDGKIEGCRCGERNKLYLFLKKQGIETMKNEYPIPIPKKPKAAQYEAETLRIPCNETLEDMEVEYVVKCIKKLYGH